MLTLPTWQALSPYWIYAFFMRYKGKAWEMLGGVMLCVSGTETMFAAMGHFSQPSVAVGVGKVWSECGCVRVLACMCRLSILFLHVG